MKQLLKSDVNSAMELSMSLQTLVIAVAGVHGIVLSWLLYFRSRKTNHANKYLAFLILVFSINVLINEACRNLSDEFPHFYGTTIVLQLLFGPFLYFYVSNLLSGTKKFSSKRNFWHFIPFFVGQIVFFPFYAMSGNAKVEFVNALIQGPILFLFLIKLIPTLHFLGYTVALYAKIRSNTSKLNGDIKNKSLHRLMKTIVLSTMVLWSIVSVIYLGKAFMPDAPLKGVVINLVGLSTTALIYGLGYLGWLHPEIYAQIKNGLTIKDKYQKSGLKKAQSQEYFDRLNNLMIEEKLYLNCDLKFSNLSEGLGITTNHLSQSINENRGVSYFDYVNDFRLKYAVELLEDKFSKRNTLQIAYEVGFNSKSAFYSAFKKKYNMSPAQMKSMIQVSFKEAS